MKQRDDRRPEQRRDTIKSHLVAEHRHDPYRARGKLPEPTMCPECSCVFKDGRWQWSTAAPKDAHAHICPACQRISKRDPAGELTLSGAFVAQHGAEIVGLIHNVEAAEKAQHALQRIMGLDAGADRIVVTTTDLHLPRRIGHALVDAYKGDLDTHYDEAGYFVRMTWKRDA